MAGTKTIDEYIAQFPAERQAVLQQIRRAIREAAPDAEERISYGMPAFWQGENLIYFAGAKNHIGIYPTGSGVEAFAGRLTQYGLSKGTIRIPWNQPAPYDLIADITRFRLAEAEAKRK
ncbi:MAG: DUF1801 domain-containing protein [Firmicutes bacterium]|nr:DUF1801 domain-containing protein [Bacillota bacterium]